MNFKPLFDRVVIDPNIKKTSTKSAIVLPQTLQEKPNIGIVVAVGDGNNFDGVETEMKVQVGDKVLFEKHAGIEVNVDDKNYLVLRQIDIIGVYYD